MKKEMDAKRCTFESFIEDDSNRFALAACRAVSGKPATDYNPLWIYGPSGCGKTHLLRAAADKYKSENTKTVVFLSAQELADSFIDDNQLTATEEADVLLIDNAEYLTGNPKAQEETAMLSMRRKEKNMRTIIASSCLPRELPVLEHVLRNQAKESLFADILLP